MAVVPVRPVLPDPEGIDVGIIWFDTRKIEPRHTIHVGRKNNAVPVYGRLFIKAILTLRVMVSPSFQRRVGPWQPTIDRLGLTFASCDVYCRFSNGQVKIGALQDAAGGRLRVERALKLHTPRLPATPEGLIPSEMFVVTFLTACEFP